jgi:hypothetical protein
MRARSILLPCSVLLAAALALAGCGDDPAKVLAAASAKTQAAGSSKMAIDIGVGAPGGGQQIRINGQGGFDYAGRKGSLTMRVPAAAGGQGGTIELVVMGNVVYERSPTGVGANLPKGKTWVKLDTRQLGNANAAQSQATDPRQALLFLAGVDGKVDTVGKETLRDARTTHYRTTLDLAKAAKAAGADGGPINQLSQQLGTSRVPADVWVDGDGRLRKLGYAVDVKGGAQANTRIAVNLELFDFGTAVKVTPPPADQVADAGSLVGGLGG